MDFDELEPEVGVEVPGAARFAVMNALRAAAREFFIETRAWRVPFGPVPLSDHVRPGLPPDTFLVEPVEVLIDERPLRSGSFATSADNGIVFAGNRDGTNVSGVAAVAPSGLAVELPERLGNEFRDALVAGALARLMKIPGAEWSNPQMAMYYQGEFEEAKARAATRAEDGFTKKRTRIVRYGGY